MINEKDIQGRLKHYNVKQCVELCAEIRAYILDIVATHGGRLGSSMGVVELTVAVHKVFNLPKDILIWDIGHQAYAHKILTGRKEALKTIRSRGGISGFCERSESEYDFFGAGHSSTSLSVLHGALLAKSVKNKTKNNDSNSGFNNDANNDKRKNDVDNVVENNGLVCGAVADGALACDAVAVAKRNSVKVDIGACESARYGSVDIAANSGDASAGSALLDSAGCGSNNAGYSVVCDNGFDVVGRNRAANRDFNCIMDSNIIAIIGDSSMSAGMAFEALNNISLVGEKGIIIVNDNDMSIDYALGGLRNHFASLCNASPFCDDDLDLLDDVLQSYCDLDDEYITCAEVLDCEQSGKANEKHNDNGNAYVNSKGNGNVNEKIGGKIYGNGGSHGKKHGKANLEIDRAEKSIKLSSELPTYSNRLKRIKRDENECRNDIVDNAGGFSGAGSAYNFNNAGNASNASNAKRLSGNIFECMGFIYVGVVDGHDVGLLTKVLEKIRDSKIGRSVVLHVKTIKGFGCEKAGNKGNVLKTAWHSVSPFVADELIDGDNCDIGIVDESEECCENLEGERLNDGMKCDGNLKCDRNPKGDEYIKYSYSDVFGAVVALEMSVDNDIMVVSPAMIDGSGLREVSALYPDRVIDVAIAEQHAVTCCAGLAACGIKPICSIYSTFLQRAYDQVIHDVALQNLPVIFAIDRAGFVGWDGATHNGAFDIAMLRILPNFVVMAPSCGVELIRMIIASLKLNCPVAIRYPRGNVIDNDAVIEELERLRLCVRSGNVISNRVSDVAKNDSANVADALIDGDNCDIGIVNDGEECCENLEGGSVGAGFGSVGGFVNDYASDVANGFENDFAHNKNGGSDSACVADVKYSKNVSAFDRNSASAEGDEDVVATGDDVGLNGVADGECFDLNDDECVANEDAYDCGIEIGRACIVERGNDDSDIALVCYGCVLNSAVGASAVLSEEYGIVPIVVDAKFVKPLDKEMFMDLALRCKIIFAVEDGSIGGFGSALMEFLNEFENDCRVVSISQPDAFLRQSDNEFLLEQAGLDCDGIVRCVVSNCVEI